MHVVTYGVNRDLMMARHQANRIQVAYAQSVATSSLAAQLGLEVAFCGTKADGSAS